MKCPHCMVSFHDEPAFYYVGQDPDGHWAIVELRCAACKRWVIFLKSGDEAQSDGRKIVNVALNVKQRMVRPKGSSRPPVPSDVPKEIAEDYSEACLVLGDSPKASAALSRRALQNILRNAAGVKPRDLVAEIQEVLDSGKLPSTLSESIDAVRNIGNFAAHPIKSKSTGEIVPVEPHEAEWNLDVIESLFDFYYVQPAAIAKRKAALNQKLKEAGKPPVK